jgi:hypothetical protein
MRFFLLKAACFSGGLEVQGAAFLPILRVSRFDGDIEERPHADGCAMYETVGWAIAISAVSLVALHVLLVLGAMSAIQLMDALGRSRQPDSP